MSSSPPSPVSHSLPPLGLNYDSDDDMQVDSDIELNKGPDVDADGESVDDDSATSHIVHPTAPSTLSHRIQSVSIFSLFSHFNVSIHRHHRMQRIPYVTCRCQLFFISCLTIGQGYDDQPDDEDDNDEDDGTYADEEYGHKKKLSKTKQRRLSSTIARPKGASCLPTVAPPPLTLP
jgi:chromodomain-helicase-DNA-binding protein 1